MLHLPVGRNKRRKRILTAVPSVVQPGAAASAVLQLPVVEDSMKNPVVAVVSPGTSCRAEAHLRAAVSAAALVQPPAEAVSVVPPVAVVFPKTPHRAETRPKAAASPTLVLQRKRLVAVVLLVDVPVEPPEATASAAVLAQPLMEAASAVAPVVVASVKILAEAVSAAVPVAAA